MEPTERPLEDAAERPLEDAAERPLEDAAERPLEDAAERLVDLMYFWMGHRHECADKLLLAAGELCSASDQQRVTRASARSTAALLGSSASMSDAKDQDRTANGICAEVQDLWRQLQDNVAKSLKGASALELILRTLGKRSGFSHTDLDFGSIAGAETSAPRIDAQIATNLLKMAAFFGLEDAATRTALGGMKKGGGGDFFPSSDASGKWEKKILSDHVTDLGQSLSDTAEGMERAKEELRNIFRCISEAFVELKDVQECIEDPWCVCHRTKLLQYALDHCQSQQSFRAAKADQGQGARHGADQGQGARHGADQGQGARHGADQGQGARHGADQGQGARHGADQGQGARHGADQGQGARHGADQGQGARLGADQGQGTRQSARFGLLLKRVAKECTDRDVREWIERNASSFLELVDLFHMMKKRISNQRRRGEIREIDIFFVAHGEITGEVMPADMLRPLPSLLDVVLYQPWNCTIDARAAYGIVSGTMTPQDCCFGCERGCPKSGSAHDHSPSPPSRTWNRMSEYQGLVPQILVSALQRPQDAAWNEFRILQQNNPFPQRHRVLMPFIGRNLTGRRVPFAVITLALTMVLKFSGLKAQLHLVACLGRSPGAELDLQWLAAQYCCAPDDTRMSSTQELHFPTDEDTQLFKDLKDMFG